MAKRGVFGLEQQFIRSPFCKYILSQFRHFDTTTEQQCSPKHESLQVAETYLTLLKSVARHRQLVNTYKCRERTTSEAANLVGLSLPEQIEVLDDALRWARTVSHGTAMV
ncbi:hypothetical protein TSMEX_000156 [Taenia solium]|eukprot:TsM_000265500 transcript=TsM_000265500 gene=TsM_000265500